MDGSIYSSSSLRLNVHSRARVRSMNGLPVHSPSHPHRKYPRRSLCVKIFLALVTPLWLCLMTLHPRRLHQYITSRFGRKRGPYILCLFYTTVIFTTYVFVYRFGSPSKQWPILPHSSTLVYKREDLQRIWKWEITSGHYPSRRQLPEELHLRVAPENPALPPPRHTSHNRRPKPYVTETRGVGAEREYQDLQGQPPSVSYPRRPPPGGVIDFDIVMDHCDFSQQKFVRDCLEVLRVGAGLDNGKRMRRANLDDWNYIYLEQGPNTNSTHPRSTNDDGRLGSDWDGLSKKRGVELEKPPVQLPKPKQYQPYSSLPLPCDPENARIFHMYWAGPFTDKPYLALLSFLYTQNTGLHLESWPEDSRVCRPKFWFWINPGSAASVPNENARSDMLKDLATNPWAAPFLHSRFKDVIEFKLWNTTEQLDSIPEIRDEWRKRDLFYSFGRAIVVPKNRRSTESGKIRSRKQKSSELLERAGSTSSDKYDLLSVIMSDMARFILCHRYGGIYLDADTVFLRDWEEIWGWTGAFAYRWSRLERYNTAVLRLNKGSALGTFLFRTALKNGLDFHPITVSKYVQDAYLERLFLRLPDALFDPAWLVSEGYQMQRPAQPYFTSFEDFFDTPMSDSAAPQALGFDGFFRGAYSYHYHNFWWKPFDPARNWPDLGPQFSKTEKIAREKARKYSSFEEEKIEDDKRDLDWATVLKRTCEAYIRGEIPSLYGEWLVW